MAADPQPSPRFLIYGAGAVGSLLGARLASADRNVTLLGRPKTRMQMAEQGLRIERPNGSSLVRLPVIASIDELQVPPDIVLLTVKAYSVSAALPDLERLAANGATIVSLQNGAGTEERLVETRTIRQLIAGSLTISVGADEPGVVRQETSSGGIALAPVQDAEAALDMLRQALEAAEIPVSVLPDHRQMKWSKLLLNILANATAAIVATDPGTIFANPALFHIERRAFIEALVVMAAQGMSPIALPGFNVPLLMHTMRLPPWIGRRLLGPRIARGRGGKRPSLWIDIDNQRGRTEIDWLNGAVVAAARRLSIPTPVNEALTRLIHEIAVDPKRRAEFAGNPRLLLSEIIGGE